MNRINNTILFKVINREVLRIYKSKILFFTLIIAPIASLLALTWIFSASVIRELPITVVDQDNTSISRKLAQMIDASPSVNIVSSQSTLEDATRELNRGTTDAIVLIQNNLEKEIFKGQSPTVVVYINNTNLVKGGVIKSGIYKTLSTFSTGVKVQTYMKEGFTQDQSLSRAYPVRLDTHMLFNPYSNYSYFLMLGLLPLMITVFSFLGSTYAVGIELKEGTAGELMEKANNSITIALVGKLVPYTVILLFHCMLMNIIFFGILGVPINGSLTLIILSEILMVVVYQLLAVLFISLTSNLRLSLSLGSAYTMMALSFSGLTFPAIGMPKAAVGFSYLFPNTFWLKIFISQTLRDQPLSTIALPFATFLVFIVGALCAFPLMSKRYSNPVNWGKV